MEKTKIETDIAIFKKTETDTDTDLKNRPNKNSSGDEIANVNFFYNIAHVEASAYAH